MAGFRVGISRDVVTRDGTMFGDAAFEVLKDPALQWEIIPELVPALTPAHAATYDAICLLSAKLTRETLSAPECRLGLVARFGVGYDAVDVEACTERGVMVAITPDAVRRPVGTSVIAYLLALSHRMVLKDRLVRDGRWAEKGNYLGMGLIGRTLGVVGIGNIGREVLRLARPFGLRLLGCDPHVRQADVDDLGVTMIDLPTLLAESDFVSINCLLDEGTRGLIGAAEFARMKPTSYFINTSRGPTVVESALVDALRANRIAGAAIDVFEREPTPVDNPLLAFDNVIVAPHAICHTDECMRGLAESAFRASVSLAHGERPPYLVNPEALAHPRWAGRFHR